MRSERIFLDYASTTPLDAEVFSAMRPFLGGVFANPSSLYKEGVEARKRMEEARKNIAAELHALSDEIIFTGSGTESVNLAIVGVFEAAKKKIKRPHFITSVFEHPAVLESFSYIKKRGAKVTYLKPDSEGFIRPSDLKKSLTKDTVLVSIMYAQNETGTVEPIREFAKEIRKYKKFKSKDKTLPVFHVDASQAANYMDLNVLSLGVDLMTLDASKIYGPKGIGLLFVKRGIKINPIIHGGGQERGLRSGTENLAAIVGFEKALFLVGRMREKEVKKLTKLRDYFIREILKSFPKARLNGSAEQRLPNNINICFPGIDSELAVLRLDAKGIMISSSSSCRSLSENSDSYVIESLGHGKECSTSSARITLGRQTNLSELKKTLRALKEIIPLSRVR